MSATGAVAFEFATADRILFGAGTVEQVPAALRRLGQRVFAVTGRHVERAAPVLDPLRATDALAGTYAVVGEPTVATAHAAVACARDVAADVVVGMGGGSAVDLGKVVAALLTNDGDLLSYLEVVGEGRPLTRRPRPYVAVPTTAGTGAEVTRNAVLGVPEHRRKVSLRHPWLLPALAVVDPALTCGLGPALTASTGLDALTQVIEPWLSRRANPLTDALCRSALPRAARSLRRAYENGADTEAREDMAYVSLCGGLALANAKLGAVHGLAGPLGGMLAAPHGALCGRLLPEVLAANWRAVDALPEAADLRARFAALGPLLTGEPGAGAAEAVDWLRQLVADLAVPSLASHGLGPRALSEVAEMARTSSSMQGNPVTLAQEELVGVLERAL